MSEQKLNDQTFVFPLELNQVLLLLELHYDLPLKGHQYKYHVVHTLRLNKRKPLRQNFHFVKIAFVKRTKPMAIP